MARSKQNSQLSLFPEDAISSSSDPISNLLNISAHSGPCKTPQNPAPGTIGDHINELSDHQLLKLISVKHGNDPLHLIRQLSRDLAAKETELILLRRKSAQREHELARLCTEYGNLSSLELDQRLASLESDEDLHSVLSGMIEMAVDQPSVQISKTHKPVATSSCKNEPDSRRTRSDLRTPKKPSYYPENHSDKHPLVESSQRKSSLNDENRSSQRKLRSASMNKPTSATSTGNRRNSLWLQWLTTSNPRESSYNSTSESHSVRSGPVELNRLNCSTAQSQVTGLKDPQTDKFGFYNNPTILREANKASKPEQESDMSSKTSSFLQNSSSSSDLSYTEITTTRAQSTSPDISKKSTGRSRFSQSMDKLKFLGQQHDVVNQKILTRWDSLMSNIEREHSKLNTSADSDHESFGFKASKLRWSDHGALWFLSSIEGREGKAESRLYKDFIGLVNEEGIPSRYRNILWLELSGASNKAVPGEFQRLSNYCKESNDVVIKTDVEQINLDLHRTLSSNKFFYNVETSQPGPHFYKLQQILYAFVAYNSKVGYSQGMNRVVGNLILGISDSSCHGTVVLETEDIFWIFVALLEELLPKYDSIPFYHQKALPFLQNDISITSHYYFPKLLPLIHQHLMYFHVEIEIIFLGWWLGLFTEAVNSLDLWFNVVDGLMLADDPGVKLITYSLAILKVFEKNLMDLDSAEEIYHFFQKLKVGSVANIRIVDFVSTCCMIEKHVISSELADLRTKTD